MATQETRGRLMRHYSHLSEDDGNPPLHLDSDKDIARVRVELSNFEYTINRQKEAIQAETQGLLRDCQELMVLIGVNTTAAKTRRRANRERLGELQIEMDRLSRLLHEEKEKSEMRIMQLHGGR